MAGYVVSVYSRFINSNNYNNTQRQVLYYAVEGAREKGVLFALVLLLLLKERSIPLMKQQFVITRLYTVLQETERT